MPFALSPLYPILDAGYLPRSVAERQHLLSAIAHALDSAGVTMLQYRNKSDPDEQVQHDAVWLRSSAPPSLQIILNDRVHLVAETGCDGAHVGQSDLSPAAARQLLGGYRILGLSTHDELQLRAGDASPADYLAVGPIFATGSKPDAEAVLGLDGLRRARALTTRPLVAIGGITLARAPEARAAGADSVAVISGLFSSRANELSSAPLAKLAKDFLKVFR